jgi:hypothetical protein
VFGNNFPKSFRVCKMNCSNLEKGKRKKELEPAKSEEEL